MAKTPNPPAPPAERPAAPAEVPRVSYVTIEGVTTVINPQPEKTPAEPEESAE